jgi:GxxExxY protein
LHRTVVDHFVIHISPAAWSSNMEINDITGQIVDAAIKIHTALGPGLLESAYEACLAFELSRRGLRVQRQVELPVIYDGLRIEVGYRIDLLVEELVIVEVKSVAEFAPIHEAQLLTHLKLSNRKVGLLMNFNVVHLKNGIKRMVNNL